MKKTIVYVHGQGGNAAEAEHFRPLFPDFDVIGFAYKAETPWAAKDEFAAYFDELRHKCSDVSLIANSIGAYFAMCALPGEQIKKAYFISPIVDMQKLIEDMMTWANVSEAELREKNEITTNFGQVLSWRYLCYVKNHPVVWKTPTRILYGSNDALTSFETISDFAQKVGAALTVMPGGEHWFHTESQMRFLDDWIKSTDS